jgi:hypothetical protein
MVRRNRIPLYKSLKMVPATGKKIRRATSVNEQNVAYYQMVSSWSKKMGQLQLSHRIGRNSLNPPP